MSDRLATFWQELKRRKVIRVITVYAGAAFVILELADIVSEPLKLPSWLVPVAIVLLSIGLIIAIMLSWTYDIHPQGGIVRTPPADDEKAEEVPASSKGWKIASISSFIVIAALLTWNILSASDRSRKLAKLERSIAVLPFENWHSDPEYLHLGDAITDEIIMQLQGIHEFDRVLSRSSTMQYKTDRPSIPVIGTQLGVNYIIEGSIQRQKDNVNIRIQVLRAVKEDHIWAEEYEGKWSDIYLIQEDIAKNVARELRIVLSEKEIEQLEKKPTDNLEAYDHYLEGNTYFWLSYEGQDWTRSIYFYERAVELDPGFMLAYCQLARAYLSLYWFHFDRSEEVIRKAKKAIDRAFSLEPGNPDAYYALGGYYYQVFLDYENALINMHKALDQAPDNAEYHYMTGAIYRRMGNFERAEEHLLRAVKNDPGNSRILFNMAQSFYLTGNFAEALKYLDMTIKVNPGFAIAYKEMIDLYQKWEGNTAMSKKIIQDASRVLDFSSNPRLAQQQVRVYIFDGEYDKALNYLNSLNCEAVSSQFHYCPKYLYAAYIYDEIGERDKARTFYELARTVLEDRLSYSPEDARLYSAMGLCLAGLGQKALAIDYGKKGAELLPLSRESWRGYVRLVELAQIYVMTGEYEKALEQLDLLLSVPGTLSPALLKLETRWKPLLEHPGFAALMEKHS